MDGAGCAEVVPEGDVGLEAIWVVLGVVVEVVAHAGADVGGVRFFERDGEMVWHLKGSRHPFLTSATGWLWSSSSPASEPPTRSAMSYADQSSSSASAMGRRLTNRNNNRYSVTALFSMAAEQDVEVEDDLARGQSVHIHPPAPLFPFKQHRNACGISRAKYLSSQRKTLSLNAMSGTSIRG